MAATYPMQFGTYYIRCHIWPNINYGQASHMAKCHIWPSVNEDQLSPMAKHQQ